MTSILDVGNENSFGMAQYGNYMYILDQNWGFVRQYNVSSGVPVLVTDNWGPGNIYAAISQPCYLTIHGNYMYIINNFDPVVFQIAINSNGSAGAINRTWASGPFQQCRALYAYNSNLYVISSGNSNPSNTITKIPINSNGTSGTVNSSWIVKTYVSGMTIYNNYVYVVTSQSAIIQYPLNPDGSVGTPNNSWAVGVNSSFIINYKSTLYAVSGNNIASIEIVENTSGPDTVGTINLNWATGLTRPKFISIINSDIYALNFSLGNFYFITKNALPPTFEYSKIQINYTSIVNGNPVGGKVFEGYYKYQVSNNVIKEFYSSTDMSTNLIISSTDSFATGALALLGKTSCNVVTSNGINNTGNNAGVFVKNLPFVNALFKSNPYVLLNPSGCVMFDNYGLVNANVLATSYFTNKYVISNGNVYSNKNNSFFSFSNFTFNFSSISALPTVSVPPAIDYTFFNTIKQIKYNAKYNGAVLLDSYFVFYLDSSNNYHMCAQYPTTENKNVLLFSDSACDNFPNTGNFGNTLGTVNPDPTVTTIVAVSGNAATATVTTSTVSVSGAPTVTGSVTATGTVARVNLNALNSNICFSEGSIVSTDQGDVEIQNIDITYHTIRGNKIVALTETQSVDDYLVKIKKNAFGNVPTQDTETTGNHMIFNGLSMVRAKTLINNATIEKIPYCGLPLYNILLDKHDVMMVNGLVCETLNPENPIAKYYVMMIQHPENKVEMENMWRKRTQEIIHSF